jgi:hypothetical protein
MARKATATTTPADKAPSTRTRKAPAKVVDIATKAPVKAPAKKAPAPEPEVQRFGGRGIDRDTVLAPSAGHTTKDAGRIGEPASAMHGDKALADYLVRWPHAGTDALVRVASAKGEGPAWMARCNEHGEVAPAANMQEALKLGRKAALPTWCVGHGAPAKKAPAARKGAAPAATRATRTATARAHHAAPSLRRMLAGMRWG